MKTSVFVSFIFFLFLILSMVSSTHALYQLAKINGHSLSHERLCQTSVSLCCYWTRHATGSNRSFSKHSINIDASAEVTSLELIVCAITWIQQIVNFQQQRFARVKRSQEVREALIVVFTSLF